MFYGVFIVGKWIVLLLIFIVKWCKNVNGKKLRFLLIWLVGFWGKLRIKLIIWKVFGILFFGGVNFGFVKVEVIYIF